jgi:hypothetical protein
LSSPPVSFVTCVNDWEVYNSHIIKSLEGEYDAITSFNPPSAAKGLNEGIRKAKNDFVVCIHQDVFLSEGFVGRLLAEVEKIPKWGALGLAGKGFQGEGLWGAVNNISWPYSEERDHDRYYFKPMPAQTLDCLCILLDRRNGIWFDEGFEGFHLYGEDFALQAIDRGLGAYVIFNPVFHDSKRLNSRGWHEARQRMIEKWRSKYGKIYTTTEEF